jgi:tetratricopeptide (TPR) repeat protein
VNKIKNILIILVFVPVLNAQEPYDLYCKGVAFISMGRYEEAISYLSEAIKLSPNNHRLYLKRGRAYYNSDKLDNALNDFLETNRLSENQADLWLSKTYARLGDIENAINYLKNHLKSRYREKEKIIKKDNAFNDLQYTNEWYLLWQEDWYTPEESVVKEVDYLVKKERYLDALALIQEKLPESNNSYRLYVCRARINKKLNNYKGAMEDWNNAISAEKRIPAYFIERGKVYVELGKYRDAVDDFSRVLRQDPADFPVYIQRAKAYAGLQEYKQAIADVLVYLKYFENDQDAIQLCGNLNFKNENYIEALKYFNLNLDKDKSKPEYYKERGRTYLKTRTYKYAINDFSMALDLSPKDGETWLLKGIARFESGDREGACSDWSQAGKNGESRAVEYIHKHCK